jgi:hypothetical protein
MALVQSFERRIADLEERLGKNSTNSSKPPSSDPPSVKRRPPAPASGRKRGGQPGHRHHSRALVPPERLRRVTDRCGPTVVEVILPDGRANRELVRQGLAWWYREHAPADQELARLEAVAKSP